MGQVWQTLTLDGGGFDEHDSVGVTEHPFGATFGTIDGDDAELFGAAFWPYCRIYRLGLPINRFFPADRLHVFG